MEKNLYNKQDNQLVIVINQNIITGAKSTLRFNLIKKNHAKEKISR